ncbi:MopE-related protein [Thermodesulfobacteriota bacterium]
MRRYALPLPISLLISAFLIIFLIGCGKSNPSCMDNDGDNYTTCEGDCNDAVATIYPGADENCGNSIDDDCDFQIDTNDPDCDCTDADGDEYCSEDDGGTDCDDTNPNVNPDADEICVGEIDEDCDGLVDVADQDCPGSCTDADDDGHCSIAEDGGDCDDNDPDVNPGMDEDCFNGIDDDCDDLVDRDDIEECGPCESFPGGEFSFDAVSGSDNCPGDPGQILMVYLNTIGIPNMDVPGYDQLGSLIIDFPGFDPIELVLEEGSGDHCMESTRDFSPPIPVDFGGITGDLNSVFGTFDPDPIDETKIDIELQLNVTVFFITCNITIGLEGTFVQ